MSLTVYFVTQDFAFDFPDANGHPTLGGSGYWRLQVPAKYLAERGGFDVQVGGLIYDQGRDEIGCQTPDGVDHWDADIVVMQRCMHRDMETIIRKARKNGQVIVADVDDNYWDMGPSNYAWHTANPKDHPDNNLHHYFRAINACSAITVSTPYLRDKLQKRGGAPVYLLRNYIPLADWKVRGPRNKTPVIGWVGSTRTRDGDLQLFRGILQPMAEKLDLRFYHGGHLEGTPSFAELTGVDPERVTAAPMCGMETYQEYFKNIDIGLAPLRDTNFNRAKSAIKLLEYTAAGIPSVGSDLLEHRWLHNEHGIGFLAARPVDWIHHLKQLMSAQYRGDLMKAWGNSLAALDMESHWGEWKDAYWDMLFKAI